MSRAYPAILAVIGWLALAGHLTLCVLGEALTVVGVGLAVGTFLSFFTILTNVLAAVVLTGFAWGGGRGWFARPRVVTGVAVYIVMVELVYTLFLRWMWHPSAAQLVVDVVLHDVMPVGYVVFWVRYVRRGSLRWWDVWVWLVYPLGFAVYNGVYSALRAGANPYPFLDARVLGYRRVTGFVVLLSLAFLAVGLVFVAVDKGWGGRDQMKAELGGIRVSGRE